MRLLTETKDLEAFCNRAKKSPYVTVDTEFHRENSYFPKLCLVQMALPQGESEDVVLIDALSSDLDLEPLHCLLKHTPTVKVFHAGRQDIEIFWTTARIIPAPLFDTQVAAMVCGFGEQVGYETLVKKIAKATVDKATRFTDWTKRPLTKKQISYAASDVTHLRVIYEFLDEQLHRNGRHHWLKDELSTLANSETFEVSPDSAWKRIRTSSNSGKYLAVLRELARFREEYAKGTNTPRTRVLKDEALLELAGCQPRTRSELEATRFPTRSQKTGKVGQGVLAAIRTGLECPPSEYPIPQRRSTESGGQPGAELLRVLLKLKSRELGVAERLIATASDLASIAAGDTSARPLSGWRKKAFGDDALKLCNGEAAIAIRDGKLSLVRGQC